MKKLSLILLALPLLATAQTATYDTATSVLTVPSLAASGQSFKNVKVRLNSSIEVISVGAPAVPNQTVCTDSNVTTAIQTQLKNLMGQTVTHDQLVNLVGCAPTTDNSQVPLLSNPGSYGTAATYGLIWQSSESSAKITVMVQSNQVVSVL